RDDRRIGDSWRDLVVPGTDGLLLHGQDVPVDELRDSLAEPLSTIGNGEVHDWVLPDVRRWRRRYGRRIRPGCPGAPLFRSGAGAAGPANAPAPGYGPGVPVLQSAF